MKPKPRNSKMRQKSKKVFHKSDKKFKKNKAFIQRSKEMEQNHLKITLLQKHAAKELKNKSEYEYLERLENDEYRPDYDELIDFLKQEIPANFQKPRETYEIEHQHNVLEKSQSPNEVEEGQVSENNGNFLHHFSYELEEDKVEKLKLKEYSMQKLKWEHLGDIKVQMYDFLQNELINDAVIPKTSNGIIAAGCETLLESKLSATLNPFQMELLYIASTYRDIYFPQRTFANSEDIRSTYCLHIVNHVIRSHALVKQNDKRLECPMTRGAEDSPALLTDDFRDQSMFRLKVLVVVPFRDSAFKIVNLIMELMYSEQGDKWKSKVKNYKKFVEDFTGNGLYFPKQNPKPVDYEQTFQGNVDDNFNVGIRFSKKTCSIYSNLNVSDILIASPVALRMILDSPKESECDFLTSIEILVIDQAEVLLAQNWEHLLFALKHLHMDPKNLPKTDCQRIRSYALNGYTQFYRQTLFFSSYEMAEFRSIFSNSCHNYAGLVKINNSNPPACSISNVVVNVQQTFRRFASSSIESSFDERFNFFIKEILPQFKSPSFAHCMILVPSYFDFVRLRNYMKAESIDFVQICEYTEKGKLARARDKFFHSGAHFMLYSERSHFFLRTRVKGIRHLIMYQPPTWPKFYSEIINLMLETNQNPRDGLQQNMSITVLYNKYDLIRLANIVGNQMASRLLKDKKPFFVFTAE